MDEIKIRDSEVSLNGQKLKVVKSIELKQTAEDGCAEVAIKLLAKLV